MGPEGDVPGRGSIAYREDENEIRELSLEAATTLEDIVCMYGIRTFSVEIARFCR